MRRILLVCFAILVVLWVLPATPAFAQGDIFANLSLGGSHNLVIKEDNSLWTWGNNNYGQLGNTLLRSDTPLKIMKDVVSVSAGYEYTMAIKTDGSLWAWGRNQFGTLGIDISSYSKAPVKVLDGVKAVSAGVDTTMAIKTDNSLWAWGYHTLGKNDTIQYKPFKVMDDVKAVSQGWNHTMILKTDDSLWAFGENLMGQLGNGTNTYTNKVCKIMDDVASVSAGYGFTMIIKKDGSLWACGNNTTGQLGIGSSDENPHTTPIKVMDGVKAVSAGRAHVMAIKTDGSLWAWGSNYSGQLGIGSSDESPHTTPIKVMDDVSVVSAGSNNTMAIKTDGTLWDLCTDTDNNSYATTKIMSDVKMTAPTIAAKPTTSTAPVNSATNKPTQEQAMAKYLTKQGSISYKNNKYNVYLLNGKFNVYTKKDENFKTIIYQSTSKQNIYNEVYFDNKGNFASDKNTYLDLRKLYLMATCTEGLQIYKKWDGNLIPCLIFGKSTTDFVGKVGFTAILTRNVSKVGDAIYDELKSGLLSGKYASMIWASNEWYGNSYYTGTKKSLDFLYETKSGINVSKSSTGLYTISDNYSAHPFLTVGAMLKNWMNTYYRYSAYLNALDQLDLTVTNGATDLATTFKIIKEVGEMFPIPFSFDAKEIAKKGNLVPPDKFKKLMKYIDLEKLKVEFSVSSGIKIPNAPKDFIDGIKSLYDNAISFKTTYPDQTNTKISKFEDAADITIERQDPSLVEKHINYVVQDKSFKMPAKR